MLMNSDLTNVAFQARVVSSTRTQGPLMMPEWDGGTSPAYVVRKDHRCLGFLKLPHADPTKSTLRCRRAARHEHSVKLAAGIFTCD
jgi:hypothetical protein